MDYSGRLTLSPSFVPLDPLGDRQGSSPDAYIFRLYLSDLGQTRGALESYNQALILWRATNNRRGQAITLSALGRLYSRMGENQEGLDSFEKAMQLIHYMRRPNRRGRVLNGMAYIYHGLGRNWQAAGGVLRPGIVSLSRSKISKWGSWHSRRCRQSLFFIEGTIQTARVSSKIPRHFQSRGRSTHGNCGLKRDWTVYDSWGDKTKALESYSVARSLYHAQKDLRGEATTLNLSGRIYDGWGQKQQALDYYNRALLLSRQAEYRFGEASTLYNIARLERIRATCKRAPKQRPR